MPTVLFLDIFLGVVQGMITGIRGLCNGIGPAFFGLIFYVFHVDLEEGDDNNTNIAVPTNHTIMEDPYGKVFKTLRQYQRFNRFIVKFLIKIKLSMH